MLIKKVMITSLSAATVLAAGIGLSGITANASTGGGQPQGQTTTSHYREQPQTSIDNSYRLSRAAQTGTTVTTSSTSTSQATGATITEAQFESQGVVYLNGNKWTYYSGSTTADGTSISANGLDPNGYRVVAAPSNVAFGTKIMTPLGMGVVHDRGTAITGNHYDVVIQ